MVRALSDDQVSRLYAACDLTAVEGRRARVALALLVGAGLRRSEVSALDFADVERSEVGGELRTVLAIAGRGRRARRLAVSDHVGTVLENWRREVGPGPVLRRLWRGRRELDARRLGVDGVTALVAELGERAGIEGLTPADLRAAYARRLAAAGYSLPAVSVAIGSQEGTTEAILDAGPVEVFSGAGLAWGAATTRLRGGDEWVRRLTFK